VAQLEARPSVDYATLSADELALACFQEGEEPAWAEFVRRFQPLIAGVVFRVACKWGETSPQIIDDLVQDTYLKVCAEHTAYRELQVFPQGRDLRLYQGFCGEFGARLFQSTENAKARRRKGYCLVNGRKELGWSTGFEVGRVCH